LEKTFPPSRSRATRPIDSCWWNELRILLANLESIQNEAEKLRGVFCDHPVHELAYEDSLEDNGPALRSVLDFLGLPPADRRCDLHGKPLWRFRIPLWFPSESGNQSLEFLPLDAGFRKRARKPGQGVPQGIRRAAQTLDPGACRRRPRVDALRSRLWSHAPPLAKRGRPGMASENIGKPGRTAEKVA